MFMVLYWSSLLQHHILKILANLGLWVGGVVLYQWVLSLSLSCCVCVCLFVFIPTCSNDSINTGYSQPHDTEYQIETLPEIISTPHTSVSSTHVRLHDYSLLFVCSQVSGWPGLRITIKLTGWDQFRHPTTANARFLFKANETTLAVSAVAS